MEHSDFFLLRLYVIIFWGALLPSAIHTLSFLIYYPNSVEPAVQYIPKKATKEVELTHVKMTANT